MSQYLSDIIARGTGLSLTGTGSTLALSSTGVQPGAAVDTNTVLGRSLSGFLSDEYNPLANGCRCDGLILNDLTATAGSAVVYSASYSFTSADVGKYFTSSSIGVSGGRLNATIVSVFSGNATLSVNCGTSLSGNGTCLFGTDDSAAMTALVSAVNAAGGGMIYLPKRIVVIASSITWLSTVRMRGHGRGKSVIKWIATGNTTTPMITGLSGSASSPYTGVQFTDLELDAESMTQGTYNVGAKCIFMQYMVDPYISNCYVHGSLATAIGIDFLQGGKIVNNTVANFGRGGGNGTSTPGSSGIGIGTGSTSFSDGSEISGNEIIFPAVGANYGIFVESQTGTSTNSFNRIFGNLVRLNGTYQKGIGVSGSYFTQVFGNQIFGTQATGQRGISIDLGTVSVTSADPYGICADNIMFSPDIGIYYDGTSTSQGALSPYRFVGNVISNAVRYGYWLRSGPSGGVAIDGMTIDGGSIYICGAAGIYLDGTIGFKNLTVRGVKAMKNGLSTGTATQQAGLALGCPVAGLTVQGCEFYDDGGTKQLYGIVVGAAITNAYVHGNKLSGNVTSAIYVAAGSITGWIQDNPGYNPLGAASVTPGASPWTYTAGNTPEVLYLSGGTVSAVTKSGVTVAAGSNTPVPLQPGQAVTVTYSAAPTAVADRV